MKITGFRIDCNPATAIGNYYVYFDAMHAITDVYDIEHRDADDIADTIVRAISEYRDNYQSYRNNAINLSHAYDWTAIAKQSCKVLDIIRKGE